MMSKLTIVCNSDAKFLIEINQKTWTCYGTKFSIFRSYVACLGSRKMSILINNWTQILDDLKESIWANIHALILIYIIQ